MKIKLPVQQQIMIEPFTERLGNPVTPGPGNAKELRETKNTGSEQDLLDVLSWEAALEAAEEYEASKQPHKKLSQECIDDFLDVIATHLTSGELVPGDFIGCFRRALITELRLQTHVTETVKNTLSLLDHG
jgi:hypothetical protein